ncbi:hypothetical protein D3C73_1374220 [compost metagenome]
MLGPALKPYSGQRCSRLFLVRHTVIILGNHYILQRRQMGDQVKLLKHQSNFIFADFSQLLGAQRTGNNPVYLHFTGGRFIHESDHIEHSALSRT